MSSWPRVFRLGLAQRGGAAVSAHLRLTVRTSTSPQAGHPSCKTRQGPPPYIHLGRPRLPSSPAKGRCGAWRDSAATRPPGKRRGEILTTEPLGRPSVGQSWVATSVGKPPPSTTTARRHRPPHQPGPAALPRVNNQDRRRIETTQPRDQAKDEQNATANPRSSKVVWPRLTSGPPQGAPASLRQRRERPPAGHKDKPSPTRNPVAIATATKPAHGQGLGVTAATASPAPAKCQLSAHSARRAGPGKRPATNAVTTPHSNPQVEQRRRPLYQPRPSRRPRQRPYKPRRAADNQPPAALTGNHHPPKGRQAFGQTPIQQPAARPQVKAVGHKHARRPIRGGAAIANDNRRRYRYRHRDKATPRVHGHYVQRGLLLKSAGYPLKARHLQLRKDLNNYQGPERTAYAQRDKGPTSPPPPSPLRSPPNSRAANPRQGAHLRDSETKSKTKSKPRAKISKGEATGSPGSAPKYRTNTPVGHLLRRAPMRTGRRSQEPAPPTISRSNKAPWQGPPLSHPPPQASPSVRTKRLVPASQTHPAERTQVLTTKPPLEQGHQAKK
ncbi:hypothetical protein WOLCODRAFT_159458 [Wolfiporia cocos MD-104 SS10]|uniref:Uncharacterized protein n=1 Tax=Wolfiporia cocos (strain MD-104) TaxID=742152 RepID=A0A2H3J1H2_WOLCO|nr:hypothetical protein WOLCODRAFT_159458 [Wolfiporia cocos MD-104 SS10]